MAYSIKFTPSAKSELKAIKPFHRQTIASEIDTQLQHEPTVETRNRKMLADLRPRFDCKPPVWELRVGEFRVFYDVDECDPTVFIRAIRHKPSDVTTEEMV